MSAPEKLTVALLNDFSILRSRMPYDHKTLAWPQDNFRISVEDGVSTIIEKIARVSFGLMRLKRLVNAMRRHSLRMYTRNRVVQHATPEDSDTTLVITLILIPRHDWEMVR